MDTKKKKVSRNGKEISFTTKEYKLLQYMMRNPGHVLSRDQLEQRGWDSTFEEVLILLMSISVISEKN